jgi:enoyl-CoA hydratase
MTSTRFSAVDSGGIVEIVFDDGGMNLLSTSALDELENMIETIPRDARAVLFRSGRPGLFAAGADMQQMQRFTPADARDFSALGQRVLARIERLTQLTAAVVDGDCFGGALDLALAFDLRLATQRARFAHPGARLGIVTGFGGTSRWRQVITPAAARRLFLSNQAAGAAAAERLGIADAVIDSADDARGIVTGVVGNRSAGEIRFFKDVLRSTPGASASDAHRIATYLAAVYLTGE